MKEDVNAPSPTSLLKRFATRKATKNASEASPAPNDDAITASLTYPRTRLMSVPPPTMKALFVILSVSDTKALSLLQNRQFIPKYRVLDNFAPRRISTI